MTTVRSMPCTACPYRRDVPSGLWAANEYDKLPDYDKPTADQPMAVFACHATPEAYCHGWAVVHTTRGQEFDLLALRISHLMGRFDGVIPVSPVSLFASGAEAAAHGQAEIESPSAQARATVARLTRKYPRLETGDE
jgi:hypothetical protein